MFATDFLLMTTVNGFSTMAASLLLEYSEIGLRSALLAFAALQILSGIVWSLLTRPGERLYAKNGGSDRRRAVA